MTPAQGQHTYNHGDTVTLTATPAANSTFAGWSGGASGTGTTATVTMNSDKSVTAVFNLKTFTIAPSAGAGGTVSPSSPISASYGSNAVFLFTPSTGYSIENVKVDGVSIGAVAAYTFTNVQADHTISVSFKKPAVTRTLHVFQAGPGDGTITPGLGAHVYEQGEVVELSTVPDEKSVFVGWSGNVSGSGPKTLVMDSDKIVIAIFLLKTYTITPQAGPGGTITPSSVRTVSHGGSASFVMIPFTGYQVESVLVDGVNIGAVTTYTFHNVVANHTISAQFKPAVPSYTLTVMKTGSGDGDVVPVVGQHSYPIGETVTLTATPATGSAFAGWSGDASGSALQTTVTMNSNKTVTASFVVSSYVINATAGEHGHISPSGPVFVDLGGSQAFAVTPDDHYHIEDVRVDGVSVGPVSQYTLHQRDGRPHHRSALCSGHPDTDNRRRWNGDGIGFPGSRTAHVRLRRNGDAHGDSGSGFVLHRLDGCGYRDAKPGPTGHGCGQIGDRSVFGNDRRLHDYGGFRRQRGDRSGRGRIRGFGRKYDVRDDAGYGLSRFPPC